MSTHKQTIEVIENGAGLVQHERRRNKKRRLGEKTHQTRSRPRDNHGLTAGAAAELNTTTTTRARQSHSKRYDVAYHRCSHITEHPSYYPQTKKKKKRLASHPSSISPTLNSTAPPSDPNQPITRHSDLPPSSMMSPSSPTSLSVCLSVSQSVPSQDFF